MRYLAILATFCLVASTVLADIPPPPLPKGKKYIDVSAEVALDKNVTGYKFVLAVGQGPGAPRYTYESIELSQKPSSMPTAGRYTYISVLAISEEVAKKYASTKELIAAIEKGTLKDLPRLGTGGVQDIIDIDDKRTNGTLTYTIIRIDAKKGITVKKERDGKLLEEKGQQNNSGDGDFLSGETGISRPLVAGLFVSMAFVSLGLWLVVRRRVS